MFVTDQLLKIEFRLWQPGDGGQITFYLLATNCEPGIFSSNYGGKMHKWAVRWSLVVIE